MHKKSKWEDLNWDIRDKGWATPERIKQVMREREKQIRFNTMVTFFIITGSILILLLILFIFV